MTDDLATRLVTEWAADRCTQPTPAESDLARWIVELLNQRTHDEIQRALARCCDSHQLSPTGSCCDPNDCGPCCENCPTCPTLLRRRLGLDQRLDIDDDTTRSLTAAHEAFQSWYGTRP